MLQLNRLAIVLAFLCAAPCAAIAQTSPSPVNGGGTPSPIAQGVTWTAPQWIAAWESKLDTNSTAAPAITCNSAGQNGTQSPATGTLCMTVTAPIAANMLQSNYAPIVANIYSANNAAGIGAVVGVYAHAVSGPNSTQVWSFNPILDIFPGSSSGGIVDEMDLNNWRCDPGNIDNPVSSCNISAIGTLYEGASPYTSQSAIDISGVSTGNAQWHQGISAVGGSVIDYATFYQNDGAQYGYLDKGAHGASMISLAGGSNGAAISVNTSAPVGIQFGGMPAGTPVVTAAAGQSITWGGGALGNVNLTVNAASGALTVNEPFTAPSLNSGNVSISTGANVIFSSAARGNDAFVGDAPDGTLNIANASSAALAGVSTYKGSFSGPVTVGGTVTETATATPASSSATCIVGQKAWDASYLYVCVAANSWRRAALGTF